MYFPQTGDKLWSRPLHSASGTTLRQCSREGAHPVPQFLSVYPAIPFSISRNSFQYIPNSFQYIPNSFQLASAPPSIPISSHTIFPPSFWKCINMGMNQSKPGGPGGTMGAPSRLQPGNSRRHRSASGSSNVPGFGQPDSPGIETIGMLICSLLAHLGYCAVCSFGIQLDMYSAL